MQLTEQDAQQIMDWLKKTPTDDYKHSCEFCGHTGSEFKIVSVIFGMHTFNRNNHPMVNADMAPMILLICMKCGNTKFFNALMLEKQGCPGINILPPKPKKNVLSFLDYFKGKK